MRNLLLSSVTLLLIPAVSFAASDFTAHTHTDTPIELKSISDVSHSYQTTSICFLGVGDCDTNIGFNTDDDYSIDTAKQCLNEGFVKLNCNSVQVIDGVCPYNSSYGNGCKCAPNLVTCPAGQVGVGESCDEKYLFCKCDPELMTCLANEIGTGTFCDGKYQSCKCNPQYKYSAANCKSPRKPTGDKCNERDASGTPIASPRFVKYTDCSCPTGIYTGSFGCAEYYQEPCSDICKTAKTDNCDIRTAAATPYGCLSYYPDCPSKCERAYVDNCRNRTAVTLPANAHCTAYFADCQTKCNAGACNDGYTRVTDRFSKQSFRCNRDIIVVDPCILVTEVEIPSNAHCSTYFSACTSKCSAWSCNSGYNQSGNQCVVPYRKCEIGDVFYLDDHCSSLASYDSSREVAGVVVYVWDDGTGEAIIPHSIGKYYWSDVAGDSPAPNYQTLEEAINDRNGRGNTYILANEGRYPAASAALNYDEPIPETSVGWYLPSARVLNSIRLNIAIINATLKKVSGQEFAKDNNVWSSTDMGNGLAYAILPKSSSHPYDIVPREYNDSPYEVWPVFEFEAP